MSTVFLMTKGWRNSDRVPEMAAIWFHAWIVFIKL